MNSLIGKYILLLFAAALCVHFLSLPPAPPGTSLLSRIAPAAPGGSVSGSSPSPGHWFGNSAPASGYLLYPNAWGQFNNHRRQFIDAIAYARALNRILVVPRFSHGSFSPSVWDVYKPKELAKLGPMVDLVEWLQAEREAGRTGQHPMILHPAQWGDSVLTAGLRGMAKDCGDVLKYDPEQDAARLVDYHPPRPYGGVPNTAWLRAALPQRLSGERVVYATYMFSQVAFENELEVFVHIRKHMVVRADLQSIADHFVDQMRQDFGTFLSAHVRRGDHQGFCKGITDCYPTTEGLIARLKEVQEREHLKGVFLAHNAAPSEFQAIHDAVPNVRAFMPTTEMRSRFPDGRMWMVVENLIAAQADYFIGNNWSTLSANIMEERSAIGKDPTTFCYWGADKRPLWYGREGEKDGIRCLCGESDPDVPYDWRQVKGIFGA